MGTGPLPKDPSQRRRRNADTVPTTVLPATGPTGPTPELPGGHDYDTRTLSWYETWRSSPQAAAFQATDWTRLHMLAELVERYWREPSKELLSEIRLNETGLGGTAADRIRMRWVVGDPDQDDAPRPGGRPARSSAARRERLLKVVQDAPTADDGPAGD